MENKSDDDGDESDNNGDESNDNSNKDGFVRVHSINNAADMLVVDGSWEPTEDDDLELLVSEDNLVCCHLTMDPIEESDDNDLSTSDETACEPHVETLEEEATSKLVCEDAEELFPTTETHIEPQTMNDTGLDVDNIRPVRDKHHKHVNLMFHQDVSDTDLVTKQDTPKKICLNFLQDKE